MTVVAYQGCAGAFSDVAARELVPGGETRGCDSFDAVAAAVERGEADCGVLPVENAIAGPIARTYELLWEHSRLRARAELLLPVELCLIGAPGARIDTIAEIRSHPVALDQVRRFADAHAGWKRTATTDTAGAVREIVALGDPAVAAIGSPLAAQLYGGTVLARSVQDVHDNFTRFFLVSPDTMAFDTTTSDTIAPYTSTNAGTPAPRPPGGDRACVGIQIADRPGSLHEALGSFAARGMDLRLVIARPDRAVAFRYRFFCDLTGVDDARLAAALAEIGGEQRVLGRY